MPSRSIDVRRSTTPPGAVLEAPLPGGGSGLPLQFVITTTEPFENLAALVQDIQAQAQASGNFTHFDDDRVDGARRVATGHRQRRGSGWAQSDGTGHIHRRRHRDVLYVVHRSGNVHSAGA